jgi:two-component system, sensor histidine kinase PdtaS
MIPVRFFLLFWLFFAPGIGYKCGALAVAQSFVPLKLRPANLQSADSTYRRAIATRDPLLLAEAYYLYGKRYAQAGEHLVAKGWFMRSLRLQEKRGDSYEHGRLYLRLADLEATQWHQADALRYAHQALVIFGRIQHEKGLSIAASTVARIYLHSHLPENGADTIRTNLDSTNYYLRLANRWAMQVRDPLLRADVAELRGQALLVRRDPDAMAYLEQAAHIHQHYSSPGKQIKALLNVASGYLRLGKPEPARFLLKRVNQLYTDQHRNEYDTQQQLETATMAYYRTVGNWKQAYVHQARLHQLEKSGLIADRNGAITRLSVEYETQQNRSRLYAQQRELAQRAKTVRVQQMLLLSSVTLLGITALLSAFFFRLYRQNRRISRWNAELVREQNHRVKNILQVISSLLNLQATRLTDTTARQAIVESQLRIQAMAVLHRRLYDRDQATGVYLADFIHELVGGTLRTFGYANVLVEYAIDPIRLSADKATALGLILNELTTNACKYAFASNPNPRLWIRCRQSGRMVTMTVTDNGPGLPQSVELTPTGQIAVTSTGGFGMVLIQAQMEQLNGTCRFNRPDEKAAIGTVFTLDFTI